MVGLSWTSTLSTTSWKKIGLASERNWSTMAAIATSRMIEDCFRISGMNQPIPKVFSAVGASRTGRSSVTLPE